jgi:hypothetical protein
MTSCRYHEHNPANGCGKLIDGISFGRAFTNERRCFRCSPGTGMLPNDYRHDKNTICNFCANTAISPAKNDRMVRRVPQLNLAVQLG